jgi:hypothetical protein
VEDVFRKQIKKVQSFADLRGERMSEVLAQVVPQSASWSAISGMTPERHRYTWELIGVGLRFAMMAVMKFKHGLECPRPMEYSPTVQPMILTPGYTAFPSGHATEAYFMAEFLPVLAGAKEPGGTEFVKQSMRVQMQRMAFRIAENRVVAGLHFPIDGLAGQLLGTSLARFFIRCCSDESVGKVGGTFSAAHPSAENFIPELDREAEGYPELVSGVELATPKPRGDRNVLETLWRLAKDEWQ